MLYYAYGHLTMNSPNRFPRQPLFILNKYLARGVKLKVCFESIGQIMVKPPFSLSLCTYIYICTYIHVYIYIYIYKGSRRVHPGPEGGGGEAPLHLRAPRSSLQATISVYVCMCVCIYIYIHIHTYVYVYVYIYIHTYIKPLSYNRRGDRLDDVPRTIDETKALIQNNITHQKSHM